MTKILEENRRDLLNWLLNRLGKAKMRPKHLRFPFLDAPPTVFTQGRVFYVPRRGADLNAYVFPGWEAPEFFGNRQPVYIEYCSGNGAWVAARAERDPTINWVAVELRFDRVRRIWSKIQNKELKNLMVIYGEALQTTEAYFPSKSISAAFINFPDPWPKRHHARHRLVAQPFVEALTRVLQSNAVVTLVTDDAPYSSQMIDVFSGSPAFCSRHPFPHYAEPQIDYGTSYFEELWRSQGGQIRAHEFARR